MFHGKSKIGLFQHYALVIFLLVLPLHFPTVTLYANPNSNSDFNQLMVGISSDTISRQITSLQNFIENHPENELAYPFLLERFLLQENIPGAISYFQRLSSLAPYQQNGYWMLARIYSLLEDIEKAQENYLKALNCSDPSIQLMEDYFAFDQKHSKEFRNSNSHQTIQSLKESRPIASAIYNYVHSNYTKAIDEFSQIPENVLHDEPILKEFGTCYFRVSNFGLADSLWRMGLELSRNSDHLQYEAYFLYQFGLLNHSLRKYEPAINYYDSAYTIAKEIGDFHLIQLLDGNRAIILKAMGKYSDAFEKYNSAIKLAQKLKLYQNLANWYFGFGEALFYLERFHDALNAYDSAKNIAQKIADQRLVIAIEINKGDIYTYLQLHALARGVYHQAYDLAEANGSKDKQNDSMLRLAESMTAEGKYFEAIKIFSSFIDKTSSALWKAYCHRQLAEIYIRKKEYEFAREHYNKSLEASQKRNYKPYIGGSLIGLAKVELLTNNIDKAIQMYRSAYDVAEEIAATDGDSSLIIDVYSGLGDAYRKGGDLIKATNAYRYATRMIEASREKLKVEQFRIGFFSTTSQTYKKLANCYYDRFLNESNRTNLDSLFYYEEMARARSLKDMKFREAPAADQLLDSKAYEEYRNLSNQLRTQQRYLRKKAKETEDHEEWDSLSTALDITRNSLISKRLRLIEETHPSNSKETIPSLQTVLNNLKEKGLGLLLYHIDEENSFVFAAAGNQSKLISLPVNPENLKASIVSLVNPFHNVDFKRTLSAPFRAKVAHQLYRLLIKPAEDSLLLPQQLVIVPDVALLSLPFEMLLTKAPDQSEFDLMDKPTYAGNLLVHRYSIIYSPTTYLLLDESKGYSSNGNILVFSNPFEGSSMVAQNRSVGQLNSRQGWRFDPLPFAEREAKKIQEAFSSTKVYKRDAATKDTFFEEAPDYNIIHLATHGFVDTTFDAFSGLVLATTNNPNDDGLIMGYEIADKRFNCELITLSACETGLGKKVAGEGVLGLPRLFLGAGAKSVLMTFWKVDDQFTSELMPEFYRLYLQKELSNVNALAEAKREILNQKIGGGGVYYQHPFFWASFTLFGSPGNSLESGINWGTWIKLVLVLAAMTVLIIFSIKVLGRRSVNKI